MIDELKQWEYDRGYDKGRADEREKTIDEIIKTLSKSEDTILSDKQFYALIELKEQNFP